MAALRELAGGRADLLAEVAGILEGAREGELDEPLARQAADCAARPGPTRTRYRHGSTKGGGRRANAGRPPFSDSRNRPGPPTLSLAAARAAPNGPC